MVVTAARGGDGRGDVTSALSAVERAAIAARDASTSDAATIASRDAETVARSAAGATAAAQEAVVAAGQVASSAKDATASTVAAAAAGAAELAAQVASEVHAEAVTRALEVAASAVDALERIAAQLPDSVDPADARRAAETVAATVAADVVAQARATSDAATRVALAVSMAAEGVAMAAAKAAAVVDLATRTAEAVAHDVGGSIAATEAASDVAVESSTHAAGLALQRLAIPRQAPLVAELHNALERDELRLHYQPMYSMTSGEIVAVEALLRWQHPSRGLLLPAKFIGVAEGPTLVEPIGDWVLQAALDQAAAWQGTLAERAPIVWVNISCDQLGSQHLPRLVDRELSRTGLTASKLGLEVTERQIVRRGADVGADLLALRDLGVALAVDDFGTGYASLDYLRRFSFDEIKIDRSFIAGLDLDRTDTAVTSSIIALGNSLDLTVVAEGVETRAQYERLRLLGCGVSQGYLMHRPAPADAITELLHRRATDA
jgi:EAL domain-containing protein (putative c-di-GMP-specific phosphodiesterase class I)